MASYDNEIKKCPQCGTLVRVKISYGIYPARNLEPYKGQYRQRSK